MARKIKIKRKRKLSIYLIFLIMIICMIVMGVGYSLFSSTLTIRGKVKGKVEEEPDVPINDITPIKVNIPTAWASIVPNHGITVVSSGELNASGNAFTATLRKTGSFDSLGSICTFYYINQSGAQATNGSVEITVSGSTNSIGSFSPAMTTSVANGQTVMFSASVPINTRTLTQKTIVDMLIKYTINGQEQGFHYYLVIEV